MRWTTMFASEKSDPKCRLKCVNKKYKFSTQNGYFSRTDCPIFLKINRVEAFIETDKLCKFHENLTKMKTLSRKQEKD